MGAKTSPQPPSRTAAACAPPPAPATPPATPPAPAGEEDGVHATGLAHLTTDLLCTILLKLGPTDIASCAQACKRLAEAAGDDLRLWLPLATARWGHQGTDVSAWLPHEAPTGHRGHRHASGYA